MEQKTLGDLFLFAPLPMLVEGSRYLREWLKGRQSSADTTVIRKSVKMSHLVLTTYTTTLKALFYFILRGFKNLYICIILA